MLGSAVTLYRRDPGRNMARFYALRLQADLIGGWAVVREWGRTGQPGRVRVDLHPELGAARAALQRLVRRKRGRGYEG